MKIESCAEANRCISELWRSAELRCGVSYHGPVEYRGYYITTVAVL